MPATMEDYRKSITEIIRKQTDILGPTVALSIARKVSAVKISPAGEALEITGDPKIALEQIAEAYITFSGEISKMIFKSVMKNHPDITTNV